MFKKFIFIKLNNNKRERKRIINKHNVILVYNNKTRKNGCLVFLLHLCGHRSKKDQITNRNKISKANSLEREIE